MLEIYQSAFVGLWIILTTVIIQAIVLIRSHRRHKGYKVGVMDLSLVPAPFKFPIFI